MLDHFLSLRRKSATAVVAAFAVCASAPAFAGSATGAATEWTQLANNVQLVDLLKSSGLQVDNQLTQISQLAEQIQNQLNTCCKTPRSCQITSGAKSKTTSTSSGILSIKDRASLSRWGAQMMC